MEKNVRLRIARQFPGRIFRDGLTAREDAGRVVYDRLPSATKLRLAERGKLALANLKLHNALLA